MRRRRVATAGAVLAAVGVFVAFAGSSTGSAASGTVTIGASLSLSGDFAADGQAFQRGYQLWAKDQNAKGGLLGKTIKLDIVSDASQPAQVTTNYNKLIGSDHDALVLGPFSTLLTVPASKVVARYGYAFVEGAGGAPSAFGNGLTNVFDVSVPVATNLDAFARWVASLPKSQRPKTAAYPTSNDPFTEPQLPPAEKIMQAAGIKTVYKPVFPAEVPDFIKEIRRLFAADVIRDYLDRLEKTKYLAPLDPDLEMDDLDELDDPDEDEPEPWLENPVMGAEELLRFSRVRQLLQS